MRKKGHLHSIVVMDINAYLKETEEMVVPIFNARDENQAENKYNHH